MFQLANLPTPIHKWTLPGVPEGFDVYVKREREREREKIFIKINRNNDTIIIQCMDYTD